MKFRCTGCGKEWDGEHGIGLKCPGCKRELKLVKPRGKPESFEFINGLMAGISDNETLIRKLIWQNGLYRGLLATTNAALAADIDRGEREQLSDEVNAVLKSPLPTYLD